MMKRGYLIAIGVMCLVLLATFTYAEYGEWEEAAPGLNPPGLTNSTFMAMSLGDIDHLYAVGMRQTAALEVTWAWKSEDGGYSFAPYHSFDMAGITNECYAWKLVGTIYTGVASTGPDNALMAGMGMDQDCLDTVKFPACMMVCMFAFGALINYTEDGGATVGEADIEGGWMKVAMGVDMLDEAVGYAFGAPQMFVQTVDGGETWQAMPAPGGEEEGFADMQFLDEDTAYLVSGEYPATDDDTWDGDEDEDFEPVERFEQLSHFARYQRDVQYRMEYQKQSGKDGGFNGRVFRTADGGMTWEELAYLPSAAAVKIHMIDEQEGWLLADPQVYTTHPMLLFHTVDGGITWDDVTSRLPATMPQAAAWTVGTMSFNSTGKIGFLGGAGQSMLGMYKAAILYTDDGGETWQFDENVIPWGHPVIDFAWYDDKLAYAAAFDLAAFRYTQTNVAPVADAGPDQEALVDATVQLDGSGSYDPDGMIESYLWERIDGPEITLDDATAIQPSFVAAEAGEIVLALTVSDGEEADTDEVTVTVTELPVDDDTAPTDDDTAPVDDDDDDNDDNDDDDDDNDDDDDDSSGCGCQV